MKVLKVVEQYIGSKKSLAMFEINRLLHLEEPPEDIVDQLIGAIEVYSSTSLSLDVVQSLISAHQQAEGDQVEN